MSTFIAASSGPQSHLAPRVRGDARRLQESRVRCVAASRYTSPCPRGTGSLSRRRDRGYHAPIRTPASLGRGQPKLLGTPPAGGLPSALRLHGSRMSTYPAARRGSNGMHGGGEPLSQSCQGRHQPHVSPNSGRWKRPLRVSQGCRKRLPSRANPRDLKHSGFLRVFRLRVQKKPPGGGPLIGRPGSGSRAGIKARWLRSACAAW